MLKARFASSGILLEHGLYASPLDADQEEEGRLGKQAVILTVPKFCVRFIHLD